MGISPAAYFLSKCLVEALRMLLLTLAMLLAFYPIACPRCPFGTYLLVCYAAGLAVSGWATIFAIAQKPSAAQLSVVFATVMFR